MARKLEVEIVGDAASLHKALGKADDSSKSFGSTLGKLGKVAVGVAGAAGIGALIGGIKLGIDEFVEASKVTAQTNAVLKSTGGIANVSAKQVSDLAESIMKKSGVDDEAIASGENLLLTFTNIRNEAGKGNDIFNQTTQIMADMSVALGQDTKNSAIQLGKALNDPIKGVTALQRVGVSFTQGQRDQIQALVESGHAMDAQKLILAELNKEFGGSAEAAGKTLPGQLNILKQTFSNLAGEIIGRLVPFFVQFATFAAPLVLRAMDAIAGLIDNVVVPAARGIANFIRGSLIPVLLQMAERLRDDVIPTFRRWTTQITDELRPALNAVLVQARTTIGGIASISTEKRGEILKIWNNLEEIVRNLAAVFKDLLGPALFAVLNQFRTVAPIVAAMAKGIGPAITVIERITAAIATLTSWVRAAVDAISDLIRMIRKIPTPKLKLPDIPGIPGLQAGTRSFGGGLAVVGERGPELVSLPRGTAVTPLGASAGLNTAPIVVQLQLDGRQLAQVLIDPLRQQATIFERSNGKAAF